MTGKELPSSGGRSGVVPALVAAGILLVSGLSYRAVDARLTRLDRGIPIPKGTLARLPLKIDDWQGTDVPLAQAVIKATSTDDHVNRTYTAGSRSVSLFIAYGVRLRDLTPHRPEVCYRGSGWSQEKSTTSKLIAADGEIPFRLMGFTRGGLQAERILVLNYYLVDGEYCSDVSLLRDRAASFRPGSRYSVQVQVTSSQTVFGSDPEAELRDFAAASAGLIRNLIEDAVQAEIAGRRGSG